MIIPEIIGAAETVIKDLKKNLEVITGKYSIQYKRELYLEHHTLYGKYCCLELKPLTMMTTIGSREVPGRKGM
jgi:hypothetical protein